jgi:hypothetical protein
MGGHEPSYLGLMLVILAPELDLTNSLLMKSPVGSLMEVPFGAVSWTVRSDMVVAVGGEIHNRGSELRYLQMRGDIDIRAACSYRSSRQDCPGPER